MSDLDLMEELYLDYYATTTALDSLLERFSDLTHILVVGKDGQILQLDDKVASAARQGTVMSLQSLQNYLRESMKEVAAASEADGTHR